MAGDTEKFCQGIELRINLDPFFTSCRIYLMNKKAVYNNQFKLKGPFKWFLMELLQAISPKRLTGETTFYNDILIVDTY